MYILNTTLVIVQQVIKKATKKVWKNLNTTLVIVQRGTVKNLNVPLDI